MERFYKQLHFNISDLRENGASPSPTKSLIRTGTKHAATQSDGKLKTNEKEHHLRPACQPFFKHIFKNYVLQLFSYLQVFWYARQSVVQMKTCQKSAPNDSKLLVFN